MLCEALTQVPHSIVFNEPNVASNNFVIRAAESEILLGQDINLRAFVDRWSRVRRYFLFYGFRTRLIPALHRSFAQIGVKEIFHANWQKVAAAFPDMRIILTARDPRDIYLSLRGRYRAGTAIWNGEFSPIRVADKLNEEFAHQQAMARQHSVLKVRYEDLCMDPQVMQQVLDFVQSDIAKVARLGEFLKSDSKRVAEGNIHGGEITGRRVARWKDERNSEVADEALQVFRAMPGYCDFWEYAE